MSLSPNNPYWQKALISDEKAQKACKLNKVEQWLDAENSVEALLKMASNWEKNQQPL